MEKKNKKQFIMIFHATVLLKQFLRRTPSNISYNVKRRSPAPLGKSEPPIHAMNVM